MSVATILAPWLELRCDPLAEEWALWEYRTWNIHRGVLHWRPSGEALAWEDIEREVRARIRSAYRRSWWRGFAFGAIVELARLPDDAGRAVDALDTRDNRDGTWQWTILAAREQGAVLGLHTWIEGYLSGPFRGLLRHYREGGHEVGQFTKDKDSLMHFLTAVARLKGVEWREFRTDC